MGQQEYETQLARHLFSEAPDLSLRQIRVRSLRSDLPGEARLPLSVPPRLPRRAQHLLARAAYGGAGLTHRCDLRLPPARHEVVTVHDLAPLRFDDEGSLPPGAADSLRHAQAVICPSQFAAGELRDLFGITDAVAIHNGIDGSVWRDVPRAALNGIDLPASFVLHSGGASTRKNLDALAEAWSHVAEHHPAAGLVLCGPPDDRRTALFSTLPRVQLLGHVTRDVHVALMSAATAVVVPSTYEGFGFPALEAMARGTAVVAADSASLPEICADAALLVPPSAEGLTDGLMRILTDAALRSVLRARGRERASAFTWQRSASSHAAVYRRALS